MPAELLNEFNSLRQRHESLVGRAPAFPSSRSPEHTSRNSTISAATSSPVVSGERRRRSWRKSLGFPPPTSSPKESASTPVRRDRLSSGLSYRTRDPSSDISPSATFRFRASSTVTPERSPTATRRGGPSASRLSPFNASKALLSPGSAAHELASLNQVNYALTLQLSDLHADVEETEREGRKRLRKLERELQVVREDLERAEQRNALLETEVELVKERENELARSTRVGPTPRRPAAAPLSLDNQHETPTFDWRVRPAPFPTTDDDDDDDDDNDDDNEASSPIRRFGPPTPLGKETALDAIFAHQPSSPPAVGPPAFASSLLDDNSLGSSRTLPFPRSVTRTVSTSSLAPLPLPMQLDPSLEQQADELVEQLMNKIDGLQDTNDIIALEREQMETRLALAQEEVNEWKERCEELAEENAMGRLGWGASIRPSAAILDLADPSCPFFAEGPKAAIAWHSESDADADTDAPRSASRPSRARRITRRSRLLTQNSNTPTSLSSDIFSGSTTGRDTPSPDSSPAVTKRTLEHELGEELGGNESLAHEAESVSSVIIRSGRSKPRRSRRGLDPSTSSSSGLPVTTADDILPSGSLRWAGPPDAETYDQLEQAAEGLIPAWADDEQFTALSSSTSHGRRRLGGGSLWDEPDFRPQRAKSSKKSKGKGRHARALNDEYDEGAAPRESSSQTRRKLAQRRLSREASTRTGLDLVHVRDPAHSDHASRASFDESDISSDYDALDHPLTRTSDYYPLALRSRYHPRMLATMMTDSALRHVVTLVTWIQFLVVLGMALGFALWQCVSLPPCSVLDRRRLTSPVTIPGARRRLSVSSTVVGDSAELQPPPSFLRLFRPSVPSVVLFLPVLLSRHSGVCIVPCGGVEEMS